MFLFFLDQKQQDNCRFLVHTDDMLFMCKSHTDLKNKYADVCNFLYSVGLTPNIAKVQEGRFATGVLDYCGYRFSGGCVSVSDTKIEQFKTKIQQFCEQQASQKKRFVERAFVKTINQKINGFGHDYKWGQVSHTFEKLDGFIRMQIRGVYKKQVLPCPNNTFLNTRGLRSLVALKKGEKQTLLAAKSYKTNLTKKRVNIPTNEKTYNHIHLTCCEALLNQNTEIINQLKLLNKGIIEMQKLLT